jgi:Tol biopolymer transport system component
MRRTLVLALALVAVLPAETRADFGAGVALVSANPISQTQADDNVQSTAISQNGRYVVFHTTARNLYPADDPGDPPGETRVGGIFRRDLITGALEPVAYGNLQATDGHLLARGAQNPSISADGRYVAFSTGWQLVPSDVNPNVDIYVRDMSKPISAPDAYQLASVKDGGAVPATWGSSALFAGAEVTPGVSLSADGTKVLFRTGVASDLPSAASTATPPGQLFVRDLGANTTALVTRNASDGSPAGGATGQPAALSADGTTVAWPGLNASAQTKFLPAETPNDQVWRYYLWRRVSDGPSAPTRRITGAVDLDDPQCTQAEQALFNSSLPDATGPCYGPFIGAEGSTYGDISGTVPALSADGYEVAFLTATPRRGTQAGIFVFDLYLTDMRGGASRKAATVPLTSHPAFGGSGATDSPIASIGMSADGRRLAMVTQRTTFVLDSPRLMGTPLPVPEHVQLYAIDLERGQIQLVSRALDGSGGNGDTGAFPSLSGDGKKIAFTSGATNLFYGDANERADAFVAADGGDTPADAAAGEPPFSGYSSSPVNRGRAPGTLSLSSSSLAKGAVRLRVRVPAAGTVGATARSRGGVVARGSARADARRTVTIVLRPKSRFRRLVRRRGRLGATVTVRFRPASGGAVLTKRRRVTFAK